MLDACSHVFWALKGKSFEQTFGAYTYKIKPFDKVEQDHTSLGNWKGWERDEKTGQYLFKFTGGQTCWNGALNSSPEAPHLVPPSSIPTAARLSALSPADTGLFVAPPTTGPARSATAMLECGAKDELKDVREVETCVYAFKFSTPAACEEVAAAGGKEEL